MPPSDYSNEFTARPVSLDSLEAHIRRLRSEPRDKLAEIHPDPRSIVPLWLWERMQDMDDG